MKLFKKTWRHRRWITKHWSWRNIGLALMRERPRCMGTTYQEDGWNMTSGVHVQFLGFHASFHHMWKQEVYRKEHHIWAEVVAEAERRKRAS